MKMTAMIVVSAVLATPAMAGVATIEFSNDDGTVSTWAFDDSTMTATANGTDAGPYTFDEATKTICGATPDGDVCATFEEVSPEVGHTTKYTLSTGGGGTAKVLSWEE